jgi:hypothetical protein
MKWLKTYKLFESLNHVGILSDIMDILSELSDEGYRVSKYNNNPKDVESVKNNLSGIHLYIDKDMIKTGDMIKQDEFSTIQDTLIRLKDFLKTINIETIFEIKKRNLSDNCELIIDSDVFRYSHVQGDMRILDYNIPWIKIEFNIR